jgi:hypothetical protein
LIIPSSSNHCANKPPGAKNHCLQKPPKAQKQPLNEPPDEPTDKLYERFSKDFFQGMLSFQQLIVSLSIMPHSGSQGKRLPMLHSV